MNGSHERKQATNGQGYRVKNARCNGAGLCEQAAATMLTLAQAAVANPTNTPAEDNKLQVSFQSNRQLHEFFRLG